MKIYNVTDMAYVGGNTALTVKGIHSDLSQGVVITAQSGKRHKILTHASDGDDVTTTILITGKYDSLEDFSA